MSGFRVRDVHEPALFVVYRNIIFAYKWACVIRLVCVLQMKTIKLLCLVLEEVQLNKVKLNSAVFFLYFWFYYFYCISNRNKKWILYQAIHYFDSRSNKLTIKFSSESPGYSFLPYKVRICTRNGFELFVSLHEILFTCWGIKKLSDWLNKA